MLGRFYVEMPGSNTDFVPQFEY